MLVLKKWGTASPKGWYVKVVMLNLHKLERLRSDDPVCMVDQIVAIPECYKQQSLEYELTYLLGGLRGKIFLR